ncbi:hypothetical protein B0H10DRAFT_1948944 [Mycena sp. CBHHK59/15]|nr:hypothetical protein B0H10DRAFT_1948944 [Mycena sp. CBHHK59/15]
MVTVGAEGTNVEGMPGTRGLALCAVEPHANQSVVEDPKEPVPVGMNDEIPSVPARGTIHSRTGSMSLSATLKAQNGLPASGRLLVVRLRAFILLFEELGTDLPIKIPVYSSRKSATSITVTLDASPVPCLTVFTLTEWMYSKEAGENSIKGGDILFLAKEKMAIGMVLSWVQNEFFSTKMSSKRSVAPDITVGMGGTVAGTMWAWGVSPGPEGALTMKGANSSTSSSETSSSVSLLMALAKLRCKWRSSTFSNTAWTSGEKTRFLSSRFKIGATLDVLMKSLD